jgi:hypothetical protein
MNPVRLLLAGLASVSAAVSAGAQVESNRTPTTSDSDAKSAVTAYAIRYNKLAMSSLAQPGANYIPPGTYKDDKGHVITVVEGRFTLVKVNSAVTVAVETTELTPERQLQLLGRVATTTSITPTGTTSSTAGKSFPFPAGSYRSEDGKSTFTVVDGRPTKFTFPALVTTSPTSPTVGGIR